MFESSGILEYDPWTRLKFEPYWCILRTDPGIIEYYQHMIKQRYDVEFERTIWGSHISVTRGTKPPKVENWKKRKGKRVKFTYSNNIYRVHWFFCVDVQCPELEDIREELGLPRLPKTGFHLTIGRIDKVYLERKREAWKKFVANFDISTKLPSNLSVLNP